MYLLFHLTTDISHLVLVYKLKNDLLYRVIQKEETLLKFII